MHKPVLTMISAILLLGANQSPPMPISGASRTAQPPDGITVRGSGTANAPASTATLTLDITAKNNAIVLNASSLQPIVDAFVRAGVQQSDIRLPIYLTGNNRTNNASIVATVHHPTVTMLENGIATLGSTLAPTPDLILRDAQVRLIVDDCSQADARRAVGGSAASTRKCPEYRASARIASGRGIGRRC